VQEAARVLLGSSIYEPAAFPGLVRVIEGAPAAG
jgi:TATA-box binding protein (TBP) (component of TFIID and TFIIIB)